MRNITPFRNASNPWLFKELSNCVSFKAKLSSSKSCALFRLWNLHNYISTLVQPFTPPALKNTYICEHFSQWNDPSWRNAGGGSGVDFLLNQTPCVSLPSSHDRNLIVHCVLTEQLRGGKGTPLCETQEKDTLFLNHWHP